jgi:hypothetical protein
MAALKSCKHTCCRAEERAACGVGECHRRRTSKAHVGEGRVYTEGKDPRRPTGCSPPYSFRSNCPCGALACGTAVVKCFGPHPALAQRDTRTQMRSGRPWILVSMLRWSLVSSSSSGQCSQRDFRKLGGSTKAHSTSPELRDFAGISLARCSVAGRVPTRPAQLESLRESGACRGDSSTV